MHTSDYLLSVFIPTKNRVVYLESTLKTLVGFQDPRIEIIVHDNSEDPTVVTGLVAAHSWPHIRHRHSHDALSQTGNSDCAARLASGRYVTYLGDDDCITPAFVDMVEALDAAGVEAANFPSARFYWPDVVFKGHRYPALTIPTGVQRSGNISIPEALRTVLQRGGTSLGDLPRVYHGVVRRELMERIVASSGSYFPGPSPDMANAVALGLVTDSLLHLPIPVLVDGIGYHSAGGRGARGDHKAPLKDVAQLPQDVEAEWDPRIPRVWLGPTIWAQSALSALLRMGHSNHASHFSFARLYGFVLAFHPDCWLQVLVAGRRAPRALFASPLWTMHSFAWRASMFIRNRLTRKPSAAIVVSECPALSDAVTQTDSACRRQVAALGGWSRLVSVSLQETA